MPSTEAVHANRAPEEAPLHQLALTVREEAGSKALGQSGSAIVHQRHAAHAGLSSAAAAQRLRVHGPNVLKGKGTPGLAAMIYRSVAEPLLELMLMILTHLARAGLSSTTAAQRLAVHGANVLEGKKPLSLAAMIYRAVAEPFVGLMLVVAIVTACPPNSSYSTFGLIMVYHLHQCNLQLGTAQPPCKSPDAAAL